MRGSVGPKSVPPHCSAGFLLGGDLMSVAAHPKTLTERLVEARQLARQHRANGDVGMAEMADARVDRLLDLILANRRG